MLSADLSTTLYPKKKLKIRVLEYLEHGTEWVARGKDLTQSKNQEGRVKSVSVKTSSICFQSCLSNSWHRVASTVSSSGTFMSDFLYLLDILRMFKVMLVEKIILQIRMVGRKGNLCHP